MGLSLYCLFVVEIDVEVGVGGKTLLISEIGGNLCLYVDVVDYFMLICD